MSQYLGQVAADVIAGSTDDRIDLRQPLSGALAAWQVVGVVAVAVGTGGTIEEFVASG